MKVIIVEVTRQANSFGALHLEKIREAYEGIGAIVEKLADPGLVLFSTLLQPPDIAQRGVSWWYVGAPISMASKLASSSTST